MVHLLSALSLLAAMNVPATVPAAVPAASAPAAADAPASAVAAAAAKPLSSLKPATIPPKVKAVQRHPFDQPAEAQEFFLRKRLPPGETSLDMERYAAARAHMMTMPQHSTPKAALLPSRAALRSSGAAPLPEDASGWTPLGPGDIGGRTLAMVLDPGNPRTIYAGTADGGIWKTTNAGASWAPVGDLFPSLAIGSLVMDPADSSTIYAGTGEGSFNGDSVQGAGVFVTTDAGDTWVQVPGTNTPDFFFVNSMAISPASGLLYAATGTGVWVLDPTSGQWTQALAPHTFLGCFSLAFRNDGSGNDVVTAGCGSFLQGGIFQNAQAQMPGSQFGLVYTSAAMGRTSLAIAPSNPNIIYAVSASNADGPNHNYNQGLLGVFRSEQGGAAGTWHPQVLNSSKDLQSTLLLTNPVELVLQACGFGQGFPLNQGWYDIIIAVDPTNSDRVFVGGIDLFRSDDGGKTFGAASYWWAQPDPSYNHADQHALLFHPGYNGTSNQILYIGSDGGVFRTSNALAQTAQGPVTLLCNDVNSKVSYSGLNHGYASTQFYDGAVFPDGQTYFGGTQDNGTVLGTDSTGANGWNTILGGDGGFVAVDPTHTNVLYGEFTGLSLQKSIDGGQTFNNAVTGITDFNFLFIAPYIMDASNPQLLWIGGSYLWRTTNGAARWSRASARIAGSLGASISAIASSPANSNQVLFGTDEGVIQRNSAALSANGGTAWKFAKPRVGYVSWLTFDPTNPNVAYATYATFGGTHVWATADGGVTWTGIDGSGAGALPDIPVQSIVVDPAHASNLYIGTDMGVFVSTDAGQNWALELTGFPFSVADALVMLADSSGNRSLYAFTHGRGAWRVQLP
ncbi:MAG TPA: hypothetical protein VKY89_15000 [Thermoanaerobaculia bacterium]|jgi:hypothetical protein|nr:hypothetical protein [Thermoanaerobaculia bacterium]